MSLWCLRSSKIKCFQVSFKRCDRWRKSNGQWYRVPNVWCRRRRVYQWMFLSMWVVELGDLSDDLSKRGGTQGVISDQTYRLTEYQFTTAMSIKCS